MTRNPLARLATLLLAAGLLAAAGSAQGHEVDSATLSLTEVSNGRFVVKWHVGSATLRERLAQPAVFPPACRWRTAELDCGPAGLAGTIEFPWLKGSETRVMVAIDWLTGTRLLRVVGGNSPRLVVYGIPASGGLRFLRPIAVDYTLLGIEHILTGFDHLLFVLALMLLVRSGKRLVATVTAFTAAHSLTLACTTFGWLSLPSPPVEAAIALSIVLVCAECLRDGDSLTHRAPWLVSFAFGLLHGLGFASSLLAIGLPEGHVPAALFFFNVGVELGQLGAIAVVAGLRFLAARFGLRRAWAARGVIYAMGTTAAYWSIERCLSIFTH